MGLMTLEIQFNVYIMNVSSNDKFSGLKEIRELIKKIDTKKNKLYLLIYLLMISILILPIITLY